MNDTGYKSAGGYMGTMSTTNINEDKLKAAVGFSYSPQVFGALDIHGLSARVCKEQGPTSTPNNQAITNSMLTFFQGIPRPVDIVAIRAMKDISPHHAACIRSKLMSIMGLGFVSEGDDVKNKTDDNSTTTQVAEEAITSLLSGESFVESKVDKVLDPLTIEGFAHELYTTIEDFLDGGTGYLEVVRDITEKIVGLNWIPYEDLQAATFRDLEGKSWRMYIYNPAGLMAGNGTKRYSLFGKNNRRKVWETFYTGTNIPIEAVSEVIVFKNPSNRVKGYGYPDHLSAAAIITLLALSIQYKSDFYTNRGVLAYILSIIGQVETESWDKIVASVEGSVGGGQNFRQMAINVPASEGSKVEVHKLASSDKTELQFSKDSEIYAQQIVSAHRVPPIIANILIPGKLGASNEVVQALVAFQLLVIGPYQQIIQSTLARTLGGDEGISGLEAEDLRFRVITSQFNIEGLDTVGRMREEAMTATNSDGSQRDVSQGVND